MSLAKVLVVVGVVVLGFVSEAKAAGISGNDWRSLDEPARTFYILGIIDGWRGFLREEEADGETATKAYKTYRPVDNCMRVMTPAQIVAILEKYLKDNPKEWHLRMEGIAWQGIAIACLENKNSQ